MNYDLRVHNLSQFKHLSITCLAYSHILRAVSQRTDILNQAIQKKETKIMTICTHHNIANLIITILVWHIILLAGNVAEPVARWPSG